MYSVTVGDDGSFAAEYVVPPALSIPLGTSGSSVDVVRNEDGTFSAGILLIGSRVPNGRRVRGIGSGTAARRCWVQVIPYPRRVQSWDE